MTATPPRRIILHIGSPKCGSTYLQRAMLRNSAALAEAGILYPHGGGSHPGNAADLATLDGATLDRHFADGIRTVIFSHEDLFGQSRRGAALALFAADRTIEVQIVVFLRPFCEFIFGDFSQSMKQYFDRFLASRSPYDGLDFEGFVMRRVKTLSPAGFFLNWQKLFPARPLILDHHHRIRAVIGSLLGTDLALDWEVPPKDANLSLRMEDCDRLAAAMRNPAVDNGEIRAMFREAFNHTGKTDAGKSDARKTWIEAQFAPHNRQLLKHFGFDNRLDPSLPEPDGRA